MYCQVKATGRYNNQDKAVANGSDNKQQEIAQSMSAWGDNIL